MRKKREEQRQRRDRWGDLRMRGAKETNSECDGMMYDGMAISN